MGHMPDGFLCHTLILEVRRPFIYPLGERPGVSRLQGSQERCANAAAIDKIEPGAAIRSGGEMQAIPRMGS